MRAAHEYAVARGVVLKGDIPIGVNRNGCDVWHEPHYFDLNSQAGAPPDGFSVNGQNWGFPTYNWQRMIEDGCLWWKRRFQNMSQYFDAYRIDHVLGFFRIWSIPVDCVHALTGQFAPSLGMTRDEIESYGLHFQEDLFTRPFISRWIVNRVFGKHADHVIDKFLIHSSSCATITTATSSIRASQHSSTSCMRRSTTATRQSSTLSTTTTIIAETTISGIARP